MNESLTVRATARRMSCSLKNVYDLLHAGKLAGRKVARRWRIPAAAVEARLKARQDDGAARC